MVKKRRDAQEISAVTEPIALEESVPANNLRGTLEEIKGYDGIVGYIFRNTTSASIDLKDPAKIIDYAILSSSALEAGQKLSELFSLGEPRDTVIEGRSVKVVSLAIDENRISVFMEKNADHRKVLKRLSRLSETQS